MLPEVIAGYALGLSLIIAIGAQNAFVLRQGLRKEHVFTVCITCAISDAILISAGVGGFGWLVERNEWITSAFRLGGAGFLFFYGCVHAWRAITVNDSMRASGTSAPTFRATILTCLALTWLNPHVYLETVMLLGSISTNYNWPWAFASGGVLASFTFFFALGYGARFLRGIFSRPNAWRLLDAMISILMWSISYDLLFYY